jgi:hypothetical protein
MLSQRFIVAVFDTSLPVYEFIKFLGYSRLFFAVFIQIFWISS